VTTEEYDTWEASVFEKHKRDGNIWVRTIYWYLDEYSCVLVRRNRLWFSEAVKVLEQVWTMIEEERETGFEHRAPAKRKPGADTAAGPNGPMEFTKIVKLDTSIVDAADAADALAQATTDVTATKMATMMSYYNKSAAASPNYVKRPTADGMKRPSDTPKRPSDGTKRPSDGTKRPSDVLIKCFKIDDLDLDESKV
jgi:hypothetical protein